MSKKGKKPHLFFNPAECEIIKMGLTLIIKDITHPENEALPWTPAARADRKQIVASCRSALPKVETSGHYHIEHDEARAIGLAIARMREENKQAMQLPNLRAEGKVMKDAIEKLAGKMQTHANVNCTLPEYVEGDEKEFLTKES